ncbi:MAG TPA: cation:proton antiporter [Longimicrobiaceae bacterium]|nr:cation:proton antiporter [Longimicrobiaceae bacterium]
MSLSPATLGALLAAAGLLLGSALVVGAVFRRLGQPTVIGEIAGGVLLGPTVLGALVPEVHRALFVAPAEARVALGTLYELGLLLLMFCSGLQVRSVFGPGERRTAARITALGVGVPLLLAGAAAGRVETEGLLGPAQSEPALLLVLGVAVSVTSVPVISRIFLDLGILRTAFARIVLAAAVLEDVLLYALLALAVSLAGGAHSGGGGLQQWLGVEPGSAAALACHVAATVAFLGVLLGPAPAWLMRLRRAPAVRDANRTALLLLWLLAASSAAVFLGIAPMLGALAAGIAASREGEDGEAAERAVVEFSLAFPVPLYFAMVGLRLDFLGAFDPSFFLAFLAFACGVKLLGTYLGAWWAGEPPRSAANLAVAMNARGGPGIVLASVALDAGIVSEALYTSLVMLAVATSALAGWWLRREVERGRAVAPALASGRSAEVGASR